MALEQTLKKDWYSILGADPSANMSDLKQKYQKLILLVSLFRFEIMVGKTVFFVFQCDQKFKLQNISINRNLDICLFI
jgi:hypothetical protein